MDASKWRRAVEAFAEGESEPADDSADSQGQSRKDSNESQACRGMFAAHRATSQGIRTLLDRKSILTIHLWFSPLHAERRFALRGINFSGSGITTSSRSRIFHDSLPPTSQVMAQHHRAPQCSVPCRRAGHLARFFWRLLSLRWSVSNDVPTFLAAAPYIVASEVNSTAGIRARFTFRAGPTSPKRMRPDSNRRQCRQWLTGCRRLHWKGKAKCAFVVFFLR